MNITQVLNLRNHSNSCMRLELLTIDCRAKEEITSGHDIVSAFESFRLVEVSGNGSRLEVRTSLHPLHDLFDRRTSPPKKHQKTKEKGKKTASPKALSLPSRRPKRLTLLDAPLLKLQDLRESSWLHTLADWFTSWKSQRWFQTDVQLCVDLASHMGVRVRVRA